MPSCASGNVGMLEQQEEYRSSRFPRQSLLRTEDTDSDDSFAATGPLSRLREEPRVIAV
jgi:hypothetical protein